MYSKKDFTLHRLLHKAFALSKEWPIKEEEMALPENWQHGNLKYCFCSCVSISYMKEHCPEQYREDYQQYRSMLGMDSNEGKLSQLLTICPSVVIKMNKVNARAFE